MDWVPHHLAERGHGLAEAVQALPGLSELLRQVWAAVRVFWGA